MGLNVEPSAHLGFEGKTYFSIGFHEQWTPTTQLISGIWELFPDIALKILRTRIYLNYSPSLRCIHTIRVAGKRWTQENATSLPTLMNTGRLIRAPLDSEESLLPPSSWSERVTWFRGLNQNQTAPKIAAVLFDQNLNPVMATQSLGIQNRVLHAETRLVGKWFQKTRAPIPPGYTVWSSLQPCSMCAAHLIECSEDKSGLRVMYLEPDPGPKAKQQFLKTLQDS